MFINRADSIAAYDRFIERVIENKVVWILVDTENDLPAACDSIGRADTNVVPVWSDRAYAIRAQPLFPFNTDLESIPLKKFIERTIPFLANQNEFVGPNWNSGLAGLEVGPTELLKKLKHA